MQFSTLAAITALAATVSANYNGTVVYTTEVHTAYTTVCPASTELTFNGVTYTATASTTTTKGSVGTTSAKSSATATPSTITASGANKAFALSGASLAGVLGLAAYFL